MEELNEICVHIVNDRTHEDARKILIKYNQKIATDGTFNMTSKTHDFLVFTVTHDEWWLGNYPDRKQITLSELEEILKNKNYGKFS
jgi:hypothetical protein